MPHQANELIVYQPFKTHKEMRKNRTRNMAKALLLLAGMGACATVNAQENINIPEADYTLAAADRADSLGNLSLSSDEDYGKAVEEFSRSAIIRRKLQGESNPDYQYTMMMLGKSYMRNKNLEKAIAAVRSVRDVMEKDKKEDETYAFANDNLSTYLALNGQYEEAVAASERALAVYRTFGNIDEHWFAIQSHAAENYEMAGRHQDAIKMQLMTLNTVRQLYGEGSDGYIDELGYLSKYYESAGDNANMEATDKEIERLSEDGGGIRDAAELSDAESCVKHRGDARFAAWYYLTHLPQAPKVDDAFLYALAWAGATNEMNFHFDEANLGLFEKPDLPTELRAFICASIVEAIDSKAKQTTPELNRTALYYTIQHYSAMRENKLIKSSKTLDKLAKAFDNKTIDMELERIFPDQTAK